MTLKTLVYLHHHIYLGVGWTAICPQNPGIARKGRGGGVLPLARIFFGGFGNVFQASFWTIWRRLLGSCMGGGVCPLPGFFGRFGSHYKRFAVNILKPYFRPTNMPTICVSILKPCPCPRGEREFPFPVIPRNTSLKFPFPSLPVAFCNFPSRSREKEVLAGN